jgi:UDP-GlcNAc:undecaprenyl-phosphate/decaprenyl-phosphate GlcNAc-1-phosphate transferase
MIKYVVLALVSFGASLVLTRLVRGFALRNGMVDQPGPRKVHAVPVPRLGGVSIFLSISLAIVASFGLEYLSGGSIPMDRKPWAPILCGATIMFLIGVWDDLRSLPAWFKFLFQVLAAGLFIWFGIYTESISSLQWGPLYLDLSLLAVPVTFLWIIGITNAFNLIDGLDGLAAGIGIIAAGTSATIFIIRGETSDALLLVILVGALVGFLFYNFNPATIFLGDSGSLVIGYILAATAVVGSQRQATALAVLIPLLIFGLPIVDTLLSMLRRFVAGMKLIQPYKDPIKSKLRSMNRMFEPDRSHIHHRLLALGFSHRNAVLLLYGLNLCLALLVLLAVFAQYRNAGTILVTVALATYIGIHKLGYEEATVIRPGTLLRWYESLVFDRRFFLGFLDIVIIAAAYWGAFALKYNLETTSAQKQWYLEIFPIVLFIQLLIFFVFKLYQGVWRAIGIGDLIHIGLATSTGASLAYIAAVISPPPENGTLAFFSIYLLLLGVIVMASRSAFRILNHIGRTTNSGYRNALIYGAGPRGQIIVRELSNNSDLRLQPVGFIDDDPKLTGRSVDRLPIVGADNDLVSVIARHQVTALIISSNTVSDTRLQLVMQLCQERKIAVLRCSLNIEPVENERSGLGANLQVGQQIT